ncbi:hypothetical protein EVAR_17569_1 [Eumeta japonica]|uniref:Uncharacterized protein n=1 Tax=Eumeta variegata TaxID=151549 RepID=A0A4C1UD89_EUMVA|nr:hypothetical protein EVAR_17569_1 [Eumeta japonica]
MFRTGDEPSAPARAPVSNISKRLLQTRGEVLTSNSSPHSRVDPLLALASFRISGDAVSVLAAHLEVAAEISCEPNAVKTCPTVAAHAPLISECFSVFGDGVD